MGLWPENLEAINLFIAMQTQLRGTGGFDYSALPPVMDMLGMDKPESRKTLFEDFRAMESEYLGIMAERREKAEREARNKRR